MTVPPMKIDSDRSKDRRAQIAALAGLVIQVLMWVMLLIVGVRGEFDSPAIRSEAVHLQFGIYIWLALFLMYTQRRRAGIERLETEELKRTREATQDTGIFDLEDETMLVQRRRLNWMYRWFLPAVALLLATGQIISAGWWWATAPPIKDPSWTACQNPQFALPFVVGATFFCFLYSRYASGMARRQEWRLLRSASSYIAGNAFLSLVAVVGMALLIYDVPYAEPAVTYVIRLGMLILGIEFLLNFVLDFYRPRVVGEEVRPAFDSRLLGLISEPGGIARSIQEAINYQFGFEVSKTWFYQLLKRSLMPLTLFAVLVLIALSGVEIVDVDERAFVERFGKVVQSPDAPLDPGLHFTYPWPVDSVQRARVGQVRRMTVGEAKKLKEEDTELDAVLWTGKHDYLPELMLLLAAPQLTDLNEGSSPDGAVGDDDHRHGEGRSVAVSLIMASVDLEYRISDLHKHLYKYVDTEAVMENVAYQVLADHAASIDVTSFMSFERERISSTLGTLLQQRFNELDLDLGVKLTFVGLQNAHPPTEDEVAKTFQDVIGAKSRKEATIQSAIGEAERMLTQVAGSRQRALELDKAIREMDRLSEDPNANADTLAAARARIDELMLGDVAQNIPSMSGDAAAEIAEARAEVSKLVSTAESKERVFRNELIAYQATPRLYRMRRYLEVLQDNLKSVRKILNTTQNTTLVVIVEMEKKSEFDLPKPEDIP